MSLLDELYQEVIMDHYRHPRKRGSLDGADVVQEGVNPGCGDEITLYVAEGPDASLSLRFEGDGCAISQATASLMTSALDGRSVAEARLLAQHFQELIRSGQTAGDLGDLAALAGIAKLPARVKCAVLPFKTLEAALDKLQS